MSTRTLIDPSLRRRLTGPVWIVSALVLSSLAAAQDPSADPAVPEVQPAPVDGTRAEPRKKLWPGMWLFDSEHRPYIHLSTFDVEQAWSGLVVYLEHPDAGVRRSAGRWLDALGSRAAPAMAHLVRALGDEDESVRGQVERALDSVDGSWRSRSEDELAAMAAELPRRIVLRGEIRDFGFPLRGEQPFIPLELDAGFGLEVVVESWIGRPFPQELGTAVGDTLVLGILSPARFSGLHLDHAEREALVGAPVRLELEPILTDGSWSLRIRDAGLVDSISF